ncbi:MAG: 23S rRNA methyltransferase [Gammaproteobacteria bacterium]|nr:23S rRNA methyltransferase [Gammaproteobacteria bacterium]|tara:strand:+ start:1342 stop:1953 length:612 start_codon:yes stop_codon:yes gene_type:complete
MGKKTNNWYKSHINDEFVKLANKENWRSRAVYKLKEIDEKYDLISSNSKILDLGSSPGGWSQYASRKHKNITITAVDLLKMENIENVNFVQSDIEDFGKNYLKNGCFDKIDLVMSDIAPNISGIDSADVPAILSLAEIVTDIALGSLNESGNLLIKLFQGKGTDEYIKETKQFFKKVRIIKPKASRSNSREIYMLASTLRLNG